MLGFLKKSRSTAASKISWPVSKLSCMGFASRLLSGQSRLKHHRKPVTEKQLGPFYVLEGQAQLKPGCVSCARIERKQKLRGVRIISLGDI